MTETTGRDQSDADRLRLQLLVLRCQAGDERAFARLFDEFGSRTLAHLRALVGAEAEDIQQEVWLTVYRGIAALSNPGAFRTWLFRTTRNRAIDVMRRKRQEQALFDELTPMVDTATEQADEPMLAELDQSRLQAAIAELPPLQREVVGLRYGDELSYAEIALVVGCPLGTVRTRLHQAKRRLQQLLEKGRS